MMYCQVCGNVLFFQREQVVFDLEMYFQVEERQVPSAGDTERWPLRPEERSSPSCCARPGTQDQRLRKGIKLLAIWNPYKFKCFFLQDSYLAQLKFDVNFSSLLF